MAVTTWEMFVQFGLAGLIFGGFLYMTNRVITNWDKERTIMAEERQSERITANAERMEFFKILQGFAANIKENREANRAFHADVNESHKQQNKEHTEIIVALGRINGYKE